MYPSYILQLSTFGEFQSHLTMLPNDPHPSIMSDLPDGHVLHIFSRLEKLQVEARKIFQSLSEHEHGVGNQWIVVLGLSPRNIEILDGESHDILANIPYHFQWEGSIGLIKIDPNSHLIAKSDLTSLIDEKNYLMGVPRNSRIWMGRATYIPDDTATKGKQPGNAFVPSSRRGTSMRLSKFWPTLVIEAGVPKSLPRLRLNAKDWFAISDGQVRIVLLLSITKSEITFEKWQLAPIFAPHPLTREFIDELRQQNPNIPPLIGQPASGQQAYSAQEVSVRSDQVVGDPLVLSFQALHDRTPQQEEGDIVIEREDLEEIRTWMSMF